MTTRENCCQWLSLLVCALVALQTAAWVEPIHPLIVPENAKAMGAVCLDGSPAAYQLINAKLPEHKDNWVIYMEGGGWCHDIAECKSRTEDHKGSSKHMATNSEFPADHEFGFYGILNQSPKENPSEFRKWNKAVMRYCDGSSFTGDVEQPVDNLYFRGKRNFEAITQDLLKNGLKDAKQVFLTGGSAGGVSVALHCDRFRKLLPTTTKFKCLIDGGYFIHAKDDPKQAEGFVSNFKDVVSLHNSTGMLSQTCTQKMKDKPYLCMFPQYVVDDLVTPIFVLMTPYDSYQVNITFGHETYFAVGKSYHEHTALAKPTYELLKDFRSQFLKTLPKKASNAFFINNCFGHTQITGNLWNEVGSQVNNVSVWAAATDWYFDRRNVKEFDSSVLIKDCNTNGYLAM